MSELSNRYEVAVSEASERNAVRDFVNEVGALVKKYSRVLGVTPTTSILFNTAVKFVGEAREHAARTQTYRGINSPIDDQDALYNKANR